MPVRLKDIAQDLNVSVVTVSKVLRNHSDISEAMKQRVLQRMRELNYQPNFAARTLVTGRTYMMGLIVPDLVHPFFSVVAKSLAKQIRPKGYSLVIASSDEDPELERQEIDLLLARQVDALIIASAQSSGESFRRIEERGVPYILIDRKLEGVKANYIGGDDVEIGRLATAHLIECGYRRIAHIRGPAIIIGTERMKGYRQALAKHGLPFRKEYVVAEKSSDDKADVSGFDAMRTLLAVHPRPDAVFCFNDPTAIGAMKAVLEAGLRIPDDVALAGAGNVHHADLLRVPLTSIDQGSGTIGEKAAELALQLIQKKGTARPKSIVLTPKLIVRESTRRAAE